MAQRPRGSMHFPASLTELTLGVGTPAFQLKVFLIPVSEDRTGNLASFCSFLAERPEGSCEECLAFLLHKTQSRVTLPCSLSNSTPVQEVSIFGSYFLPETCKLFQCMDFTGAGGLCSVPGLDSLLNSIFDPNSYALGKV